MTTLVHDVYDAPIANVYADTQLESLYADMGGREIWIEESDAQYTN